MNRIFAFSAITAIATVSQAAVPSVSSVTMSQDDNRTVTITYKLANAPAVVTVDIETNAGNNVWASIGGQHIQRVTGDVWKKVSGKDTDIHEIKWRPDKDWPDHQVADGNARAKVTAWALNSTPNYMVVDITAGAQPNTQRYYPSKEFVPGGVLGNTDYRTSKLLMRRIPAKDIEWTAGSLSEYGRTAARETQFLATLTNDFYIGVFEITQQQWLGLTGKSPSYFATDGQMRPVEQVCINEIRHTGVGATDRKGGYWPNAPYAGSFLDLLRGRTGLDFDLPFEAQWEFACRAGCGDGYWNNGLPYTSSETDSNLPGRFKTKGLVDGQEPAANCGPEHGTAICGGSDPNGWGLYDMHGNVAEWCMDWFSNDISSLKGLPNVWMDDPAKPALDNHGATDYRPVRGGCWNEKSANCRSAFRDAQKSSAYRTRGLRVTCTAGLD